MFPGEWQFWDVGEAITTAASSCGEGGLKPWPIGLPDWLELRGLGKRKRRLRHAI